MPTRLNARLQTNARSRTNTRAPLNTRPRTNGRARGQDTFTLDELCEAVELKPLARAKGVKYAGCEDYNEGVYEQNIDTLEDIRFRATVEALREDEDLSQEDAEEIGMKAEEIASNGLFTEYINAATGAIENQLAEHFALDLTEVVKKNRKKQPLSYSYKITPLRTWRESLGLMLQTINGVGYERYSSVREFLDSGPYTEREAVLGHLGYLAQYGKVYGVRSLHDEFKGNFDSGVRRL